MDLKDQDYWLGIFKKWSESGLAQKIFCARNDLRYAEFVTWRSRLIEAGLIGSARHGGKVSKKSSRRFVPVSVSPKPVASEPLLELSLGHGVVLRMRGGV